MLYNVQNARTCSAISLIASLMYALSSVSMNLL